MRAREITILLVEDSKEDVFLFRWALEKTGIEATLLVAPNGKVALDLLANPDKRQQLDIVFLDLKMPMIGGFEVLRCVQQQHFQPPLRIVVLSGSPHEQDEALARNLGASDYVVKPMTTEGLRHWLALLSEESIRQT